MGRAMEVVLVVEDDVELRKSLCALFEDEGYPTVAASNGRDALDWLASGVIRPRLILLDLTMCEMDGEAFRERIAHDPRYCSTPTVVMSAREDVREVAKKLGVRAALLKPFGPDKLLRVVKELSEERAR